MSDPTCLLFVSVTAKPEEEAAFDAWYKGEYIPAFVREVPGILRARRFKSLSPGGTGAHTYLTIYEFPDEAALQRGLEVMRTRQAWRTKWKAWEVRALVTFDDGLFRTTLNLTA